MSPLERLERFITRMNNLNPNPQHPNIFTAFQENARGLSIVLITNNTSLKTVIHRFMKDTVTIISVPNLTKPYVDKNVLAHNPDIVVFDDSMTVAVSTLLYIQNKGCQVEYI